MYLCKDSASSLCQNTYGNSPELKGLVSTCCIFFWNKFWICISRATALYKYRTVIWNSTLSICLYKRYSDSAQALYLKTFPSNYSTKVVDVTTLKMAMKPVNLQKENLAGCAGEGKQNKGNQYKRIGRFKDNQQ